MGLFDLETSGTLVWNFERIKIIEVQLGFTKRKYEFLIFGAHNHPEIASNNAFSVKASWELGEASEIVKFCDPIDNSLDKSAAIKCNAPFDPWLVESPSITDIETVFSPRSDFGLMGYVCNGPFPWSSYFLSKEQKDKLLSDLQMLPPEIENPNKDGQRFYVDRTIKILIKHFPANGLSWKIQKRTKGVGLWEEYQRTAVFDNQGHSITTLAWKLSKEKDNSWYMATYNLQFLDDGEFRFKVKSNYSTRSSWSEWRYVDIVPEIKIRPKPRPRN